MIEPCYVVSVHHTLRNDRYITIWRPDDKGYCYALSRAGKYPLAHVMQHLGYYNSGNDNVAVPCDVLDAIAVDPVKGHNDNDAGPVVEHNRTNWKLILSSVVAIPAEAPKPDFRGCRRSQTA